MRNHYPHPEHAQHIAEWATQNGMNIAQKSQLLNTPDQWLAYVDREGARLKELGLTRGDEFTREGADTHERYFYHVAPAAARESIRMHGLTPEKRDKSPWSDLNSKRLGFPAGTFLFEHPQLAAEYVNVLYGLWKEQQAKQRPARPGEFGMMGKWQPSMDDFIDYGGMHVGEDGEPWLEDYDEATDDYTQRPYNHETDRHEHLPAHMQGWDIWKVRMPAHMVRHDPEPLWRYQDDGTQYFSPESGFTPDSLVDTMGEEGWDYFGDSEMSTPRWYTPVTIDPQRAELHDHAPLVSLVHGESAEDWSANRWNQENVMEEADEKRVPDELTMTSWPNYEQYAEWVERHGSPHSFNYPQLATFATEAPMAATPQESATQDIQSIEHSSALVG